MLSVKSMSVHVRVSVSFFVCCFECVLDNSAVAEPLLSDGLSNLFLFQ